MSVHLEKIYKMLIVGKTVNSGCLWVVGHFNKQFSFRKQKGLKQKGCCQDLGRVERDN